MANYLSPTVIQQPIPVADMTPLERLVLSLIFDAEPDGEALYFHASLGPSDAIGLSIDDLRTAFVASSGVDSTAATYAAELIRTAGGERLMWGSDWPFAGLEDIVKYGDTIAALNAWVPDIRLRRQISGDTPLRFYFA